jgi:hypothetical protein
MTQNEIIWQNEVLEMARQVGWPDWEIVGMKGELKAFAKLVEERTAAKEREACAKVCDDTHFTVDSGKHFAARIRARGEA